MERMDDGRLSKRRYIEEEIRAIRRADLREDELKMRKNFSKKWA